MQEAEELVNLAVRETDLTPLSPCDKECAHLRIIQMRLKRGDDVLKLIPRLIETIESMDKRIADMTDKLSETSEIVSAWNNVKGFNRTMAAVSAFIKVSAPIVAIIGLLWMMLHDPVEAVRRMKDVTVVKQ